MNQFEVNQIRSKLRRLDLDDQFIERYIDKLIRNKETFVTASKAIDRWDKKDTEQFVLQALACVLMQPWQVVGLPSSNNWIMEP